MKLYDNDAYRDEFMEAVYNLLSDDSSNDRANQVIDLFDAAPAVKAEPSPSNDPLTLEQLREMDGEPVWVTVSASWRESGILGGWCLVSYHITDDQVRVYLYNTRSGASFFPQQDYGISWWAYRRKPNALNENVPKLDTIGDQVNCAQVGHQGGQTMRILKPGAPCPCCGQPIKEGLSTETIMLLSWLQEGKELREALKGVDTNEQDCG